MLELFLENVIFYQVKSFMSCNVPTTPVFFANKN